MSRFTPTNILEQTGRVLPPPLPPPVPPLRCIPHVHRTLARRSIWPDASSQSPTNAVFGLLGSQRDDAVATCSAACKRTARAIFTTCCPATALPSDPRVHVNKWRQMCCGSCSESSNCNNPPYHSSLRGSRPSSLFRCRGRRWRDCAAWEAGRGERSEWNKSIGGVCRRCRGIGSIRRPQGKVGLVGDPAVIFSRP